MAKKQLTEHQKEFIRNFIGIELNPDYIEIAENRLEKELGMFV